MVVEGNISGVGYYSNRLLDLVTHSNLEIEIVDYVQALNQLLIQSGYRMGNISGIEVRLINLINILEQNDDINNDDGLYQRFNERLDEIQDIINNAPAMGEEIIDNVTVANIQNFHEEPYKASYLLNPEIDLVKIILGDLGTAEIIYF